MNERFHDIHRQTFRKGIVRGSGPHIKVWVNLWSRLFSSGAAGV
jgi:hypothetical protein